MKLSSILETLLRDYGDITLQGQFAGVCKFQLWTGTMPAATTDADPGTMLVEITMPDPMFDFTVPGLWTLIAAAGAAAVASGTATYFRVKLPSTVIGVQGSVGIAAEDCVLDSATIVSGNTVTINGFTLAYSVVYP